MPAPIDYSQSSLYSSRCYKYNRHVRKFYSPPLAVLKQEKWRRKQINMLYLHGRPLFGTYQHDYRDV